MNIPKAIEILGEHIDWCDPVKEVDTYDALKLGVEALKFRLRWEQQEGEDDFPLLPGETRE